MTQQMLGAVAALATVVVYGAVTDAQAPVQSPVPPPAAKIQAGDAPGYAFDITKAEIDYVLKNAPANPPDRQLRVVDMGKYNLGVGIVRRGPHQREAGRPGAGAVARLHAGGLLHHVRIGSPDDRRRDPESAFRPGAYRT